MTTSEISREPAYVALFTLIQTAPGITLFSRRLRALKDMSEPEFPALFMTVGDQDAPRRTNMPARRHWKALLYLYVSNPDPNIAVGPQLNGLLDGVEAVLEPPPYYGTQTLGGVVDHCWIDGRIEIFEGTLGGRAAALIPVTMMIP